MSIYCIVIICLAIRNQMVSTKLNIRQKSVEVNSHFLFPEVLPLTDTNRDRLIIDL